MFGNYAKPLILGIFSLILGACSGNEKTSPPPCSYTSTPKIALKHSTEPDKHGLPFPQDKLIELMWIPSSQSECFLRKNGNVNLYKTFSGQSDTTDNFVQLKPAPASAQQNWQNTQQSMEGILLGLTTFSFYTTPVERIVRVDILLRADGKAWHLWHEYAHYLIGQMRVSSPDLRVKHVIRSEVDSAFEEAIAAINHPEDFAKKFKIFSDLQYDYIQKNFVDEILIEKTIQDITAQAPELLPLSMADVSESQDVVDRFIDRYLDYDFRQRGQLNRIIDAISQEQQSLIEVHIMRLNQQNTLLLGFAP